MCYTTEGPPSVPQPICVSLYCVSHTWLWMFTCLLQVQVFQWPCVHVDRVLRWFSSGKSQSRRKKGQCKTDQPRLQLLSLLCWWLCSQIWICISFLTCQLHYSALDMKNGLNKTHLTIIYTCYAIIIQIQPIRVRGNKIMITVLLFRQLIFAKNGLALWCFHACFSHMSGLYNN